MFRPDLFHPVILSNIWRHIEFTSNQNWRERRSFLANNDIYLAKLWYKFTQRRYYLTDNLLFLNAENAKSAEERRGI